MDPMDDDLDLDVEVATRAPMRTGYVVVLAVSGTVLLLALAVAAGERFGLLTPSSPPAETVGIGEEARAPLRAGVDHVVYVDSRSASDVRCRIAEHSDAPVHFDEVLNQYAVTGPLDTWYAVRWLRVSHSGTYRIRCDGADGSYGVGRDQRLTRFVDERVVLGYVPAAAVAFTLAGSLAVRFTRRDA